MVKVDEFEVAEGLFYSKDHIWVKKEDRRASIGITDFAQKQLKEIVFVGLPDEGSDAKKGEPFGSVESVKAVVDLMAPISGAIKEVNRELEANPGLLNQDPYGEGWILVIEPSKLEAELKTLMPFEEAVKWHKEIIAKG